MSILDINSIRTKIKTLFDAENTSTGAPFYDLSSNLSTRVRQINTFNPSKIYPNADQYPCICIYSDSKSVTPQTVAVNQLVAKRRGEYRVKVAGMIWNQNFSNVTKDPADDDCEILMENIEYVLRAYPNLSNETNVLWQKPENVNYYDTVLDEQTHLRAGVLDLLIIVDY